MIQCRFTDCSNDEMIHHINQVGKLNIPGIGHSAMFVPANDLHHTMVTSHVKDVPVEETWDLGLIYKTKEEYLGDRKRA